MFEIGDLVVIGPCMETDYVGEMGQIREIDRQKFNIVIEIHPSDALGKFAQRVMDTHVFSIEGLAEPVPPYTHCAQCGEGVSKLDYLCDDCRQSGHR